jgi:pimeloyl-ACP methyl ester carboxylesterase
VTQPTSRAFTHGAVTSHFLDWNPAGTVPVLLLHGWLDHAHSFDPVCAALDGPLRALALDFRGHGRSGHLPEGLGYEVGQYLADLHALLAHERLSRVHLVGHSLGGAVALAYAAAQPERVASVTCIDNAGAYGGPPSRALEKLRAYVQDQDKPSRRAVYADIEAATGRLLARSPEMPRAVAEHLVRHGVEAVDGGGVRFRFDPALRRAFAHTWDDAQVESLLRAVPCPVQLLLGTRGHLKDDAALAARCAWLRAGPPTWLEGGHHLHLEQPAATAQAVSSFMLRHA